MKATNREEENGEAREKKGTGKGNVEEERKEEKGKGGFK